MEQKNRPKPHMKRQLIKIRAEINELETSNTVEQNNKLEAGSLKELIRSISHLPDLFKRTGKGPKLIKL